MASLFSFSPLRHRFCGSIGTEDEGEAASRCAYDIGDGAERDPGKRSCG